MRTRSPALWGWKGFDGREILHLGTVSYTEDKDRQLDVNKNK